MNKMTDEELAAYADMMCERDEVITDSWEEQMRALIGEVLEYDAGTQAYR